LLSISYSFPIVSDFFDLRKLIYYKTYIKKLTQTVSQEHNIDWLVSVFDDNAGIVIDKQGMPLGTRVLGPIAREVKEVGFNKIASLAREVV